MLNETELKDYLDLKKSGSNEWYGYWDAENNVTVFRGSDIAGRMQILQTDYIRMMTKEFLEGKK